MPTIATLLDIATLAGSETPAFLALWSQVVSAMSTTDQAKLKDAYERAKAASDVQHEVAQKTGK